MEDDIAEKMWNALVVSKTSTEAPIERISLEEQKKFLKKNIDAIGVKDRIDIGNIIILNNCKDKLKSSSEGLLIDLDKLPNAVINQMYDLILYKLEKVNLKYMA